MKTKINNEFAVFILTHGRPDAVVTYQSLKRSGYTGRIVLLIDDEDKTRTDYLRNFPGEVEIFSKDEIVQTFDIGDNFRDKKGVIIYARNACFEVAKRLKIPYFIMLDDDYTRFLYKFNEDLVYRERAVKQLDKLFALLLNYYKSIECKSIAMAQNGDFIGGKNSTFASTLKPKRKCMNTFICATSRPFQFVGRINEDVNTYTSAAARGDLFLTIPNVAIIQKTTQKNSGGMSETYLDSGTYVKSFYSVMYAPSCVVVKDMGHTHRRLHHRIKWPNAVPVIVPESAKK